MNERLNKALEYIYSGCKAHDLKSAFLGTAVAPPSANSTELAQQLDAISIKSISFRPGDADSLMKDLAVAAPFFSLIRSQSALEMAFLSELMDLLRKIAAASEANPSLHSLFVYAQFSIAHLHQMSGDLGASRLGFEEASRTLDHGPNLEGFYYLQVHISDGLNDLGILLCRAGAFKRAVSELTRAVDILDRLSTIKPSLNLAHERSIALTNLGNAQQNDHMPEAALGSFEAALDVIDEVEPVPRRLMTTKALLLNNIGILHAKRRVFDKAQSAYNEAFKIQQGLFQATSSVMIENEMAGTLNNIGLLHNATDQFDTAASYLEEAYTIRQRLKERSPREYLSGYAEVTSNLGMVAHRSNDLHKAIRFYKETEEAYDDIESMQLFPTAGERVGLLLNLALSQTNQTLYDEALDSLDRSTAAIEEIEARDSTVLMLDRGKNELAYGNIFRERSEYEEAIGCYQSARRRFESLRQGRPDAFIYELMLTHNNEAVSRSGLRDFAGASLHCALAKQLVLQLHERNPSAYQTSLARCCMNHGGVLTRLRQFRSARKELLQSKDLFEVLAARFPDAFNPILASVYASLAANARYTWDLMLARQYGKMGTRLYETLIGASIDNLRLHYVQCLQTFGQTLLDLGELAQAKAELGKARRAMRRLYLGDRAVYKGEYVNCLSQLGILYGSLRRPRRAELILRAALPLARELAASEPRAHTSTLSSVYNNLGNIYANTGQFENAEAAYMAAIEVVENSDVEGMEKYLEKGTIPSAYKFAIFRTHNVPADAYRYALCLRETLTFSEAEPDSLAHALAALQKADEQNPARHMVLIPNALGRRKLSIGVLTAVGAQWFIIDFPEWRTIDAVMTGSATIAQKRAATSMVWGRLPPEVTEALTPGSNPKVQLAISGDENWTSFPWELMRFGTEPSDFVGLHYPLTRLSSCTPEAITHSFLGDQINSTSTGPRSIAILAPHTVIAPSQGILFPLQSAYNEALSMEEIAGRWGMKVTLHTGEDANDRTLADALSGRHNIIHFTGHGAIGNGQEHLLLHAEECPHEISYFGGEHLAATASQTDEARLLGHGPLVVLNCCLSGRTSAFGGKREDLVSKFLDAGATGVIASKQPIYATFGERIGSCLLQDDVMCQDTLSELVVKLRSRLSDHDRLSDDDNRFEWADIHFHGLPYAPAGFLG